jgi:hypothetical protein
MNSGIQVVLEQIGSLPPDWHGAGTMSVTVLRAMAKPAEQVGQIHHSAETGSGKTTLLFSRLSDNHTAFALDCGGSVSRVKDCDLFKAKTVTFVEGPSQVTLPHYRFKEKLQMALIDGPHAYPFPDLEYYYFYPQMAEGGLLLIDDINIPSIERMCEIIGSDDMFELLEVVQNTAFFRRTTAPLIDPLGDDWPRQGFNRSHYEYAMAREQSSPTSRRITRLIPSGLKQLVPVSWKTKIFRKL